MDVKKGSVLPSPFLVSPSNAANAFDATTHKVFLKSAGSDRSDFRIDDRLLAVPVTPPPVRDRRVFVVR